MSASIPTYKINPTFGSLNETQGYASRIVAAGGTITNATLQLINNYIYAGMTQGWWSKKLFIWIPCGSNLAAAMIPLKPCGDLVNHGFVSADYSESTGLTHNVVGSYLDLGFSPSTVGTLINHLAAYSLNGVKNSAGSFMGCVEADSTKRCIIDYAAGVYRGGSSMRGGSGLALWTIDGTTSGRFIANRTTLSRVDLYRAGTSIANTTNGNVSDTVGSSNMYGLGINSAGTLIEPLTDRSLGEISVGRALTSDDCTNETTAMQTLQVGLGRGV